ncbi:MULTISPECIES: helix-turn-helix transcriptional regulator [unclassified Streptomyces]|uniref:helix-turn-helix domain-containing protein n=1 Tax=unclassified Streptomyces TaxID=2593676 RepID=UPI0013710FFC|nr:MULTISPECIES: helix-turn-helix transcriptional regulator [unclassified Streptomyces]NDZ98553.1 helix-turn-helix transcriptional regulator [Streptomyces sp. SID10116]MYY79721.1 helix-turn-helix domain-containing protein [Streptomyces sp. SID335]MYZ12805.1 helix-turn-helix domain-containing protein [Streptomyces sp. SID337]NDZ84542.1 helix-turn-helix transcriptional regulator [Streptomyces sp. SID10115]NEB43506.1 helix-turn-helix transcriptional regulator [Streptomyces sp. SID339]
MSTYALDVPELHRRLNRRRLEHGQTWRQLADAVGISASTLSRLADRKRPDADALVSLLVWLDLDTDIALLIKPKDAA